MFQAVPLPIIRSSNCTYSFWYCQTLLLRTAIMTAGPGTLRTFSDLYSDYFLVAAEHKNKYVRCYMKLILNYCNKDTY
jgi:hypothetical protein